MGSISLAHLDFLDHRYIQNYSSLKQIKDCVADSEFKNDIKVGRSFKNEICNLLNSECHKQKRFGKSIHKNIFYKWKIKGNLNSLNLDTLQ